MEQAKIDIEIGGNGQRQLEALENKIEQTATGTKSVKMQLRELTDRMAEIGDVGNPEFQKLAQEAGKLRDQMNNATKAINTMASDFPKIQLGAEAMMAVGAGAQFAMGAQTLLGDKNKEVAESLRKLMAVQSMMNGVQTIAKMLSDETLLGLKLRVFWQKLVNKETKTGIVIQRVMNAVMRANPIGLIITAVAALIGLMSLLAGSTKKVTNMFRENSQALDNLTDRLGKHKDLILIVMLPGIGLLIVAYQKLHKVMDSFMSDQEKAQNRQERLQKAQSKAALKRHQQRVWQIEEEREARKEAFEEQNEIFDLEIDRMEAEGKNADMLKKAKIEANLEEKKAELETINELLNSWTQYYTDLFRISGKSKEEFLAMMKGQGIDLVAMQEQANEKILEAEQEIYKAETELIKFNRELKEKSIEKEVKDEKEKEEKLINLKKNFQKIEEEFEERRLKAIEERRKIEIGMMDDEFQQKREKLLFEHEQSIADLDSRITEENDLIIAKELELKERLKEIDEAEKADKEKRDKEHRKVLADGAQELFDASRNALDFLHKKDMKNAQEKTARGEKLTRSEIKRLKRQEKVQKLFALAQIAADTARGVTGAIAAGAGLVFPFNLGAIAAGVAAVLSGAAQAAGILGESVDIPSPSEVSSDSQTASEQATNIPDVNTASFGNTIVDNNPKVVVVEDINNGQSSVAAIEAQASFN